MQRRSVLVLALVPGFHALSNALPAGAQPGQLIRRIGFVEAGSASANQHFVDAFVAGLREAGYVQGSNVTIETRWADGQPARFEPLLAELVKLAPEVIVVASSLGAVAARDVVKRVP